MTYWSLVKKVVVVTFMRISWNSEERRSMTFSKKNKWDSFQSGPFWRSGAGCAKCTRARAPAKRNGPGDTKAPWGSWPSSPDADRNIWSKGFFFSFFPILKVFLFFSSSKIFLKICVIRIFYIRFQREKLKLDRVFRGSNIWWQPI